MATSGEQPVFGRRVLTAGAWNYGYQFLFLAIRFVVFGVLVGIIGLDAYGVVSIALLTLAYSGIVEGQAVSDAVIQLEKLEQGHSDAVFYLQLAAGSLFAAACVLLAGPIAAAFNEPLVADMIPWLAIPIVLTPLSSVPIALLQRELRYGVLGLRTLAGIVVGYSVGLAMALNGFGAWSLIGQQVTMRCAEVAVLFVLSRWRPRLSCRARHFRDVIGMTAKMSAAHGVGMLFVNMPRTLLGLAGGPVAIALFNVGFKVVDALRVLILVPLMTLWFPVVAAVQGDREKLADILRTGILTGAIAGAPAFAGLAAVAPVFAPLWLGDEGPPAVPVIQALCALGLVWSLMSVNEAIFRGLRRQLFVMLGTLAQLILSTLFLYYFGRWDAVAASWVLTATVSAQMLWEIALLAWVTPLSPARILGFYAPPIVSAAIMFAAVTLLRLALVAAGAPGIVTLAACIAAGLGVYAAALTVTAPSLARELASRALALVRA